MRAMQYTEFGGPEVLIETDVEEPHAGPGQVRIAVRAASVNPADWKLRSGASPRAARLTLPHIPGVDAAGVVDEVGEGAQAALGDEIFGPTVSGAFAEFALLQEFAAKPAALGWPEAAGLPSAVETATRGLQRLGLQKGETLVISGAAGGVGAAAVQLALAAGATVIGTAGPDNLDYLRSLGATALNYGDGLVLRVRELAPQGIDRALDVAGKGTLPELIELTGSPDRVITLADPDAAAHGVVFEGGADGRAFWSLAPIAESIERGEFSLPVSASFPLARASEAHRLSETGHVRGKIVVTVD